MKKVKYLPSGSRLQLMFNESNVVGQICGESLWFRLESGQRVRFNRRGSFKLVKVNKKSVHLEIKLPRKKWNPKGPKTYTLKLGIGIKLTIVFTKIHLVRLDSAEIDYFDRPRELRYRKWR